MGLLYDTAFRNGRSNPTRPLVEAASGFLVLSQALDNDAVHLRELLSSEAVNPLLDLAPGRAVVPARSVVGWFEDALRFHVQDHPPVDEGVASRFKDGRVLPYGIEEQGSESRRSPTSAGESERARYGTSSSKANSKSSSASD